MTYFTTFSFLGLYDILALAVLLVVWGAIGWRIEHPSQTRPSTSLIMAGYRRAWMDEMVTREVRIFDAQTIGTLRQGTSFFASTCVIAIGGTLALIGNAERVAGVAADLTNGQTHAVLWELKLLLIVFFLTNAFLKFVWANRLFGYCSVVMGAVPNDARHEKAKAFAGKAAELNIAAARSFNRGLRAIYFALAAAAWLAGAPALVAATCVTAVVIWRREFASQSRRVLLEDGE